jgi:hypothetical protein
MGLLEENFRLPMVPPTTVSRARIRSVLETTGLLAEVAAR